MVRCGWTLLRQDSYGNSTAQWREYATILEGAGSNSVIGMNNRLAGKRALVVEDEALLALEIAEYLTDAGLEVVGPATSVAKALTLVNDPGCDIVILDINLGSEHSEPVALELKARGIPFVIVSGNSRDHIPAGFAGAPSVSKPVEASALLKLLRSSISGNG
jgi:DNA-binding response OmpR family regulator